MSEYRRYNLTLTVADPSARDRFRALSRPESFFEIRPNRSPGQRGAYSVEMTQDEYEAALEDAANPESNLLVIEPNPVPKPWPSVPGEAAVAYTAMSEADSLGLTGSGVVVGQIDSGISSAVAAKVSIKIYKSFNGNPNYTDLIGHGSEMVGLSIPPGAQVAMAQTGDEFQASDDEAAAAAYWLADEVGVDVMLFEIQSDGTTALSDAVRHALSKNIIVVAPNGNGGADNAGGPGQNIAMYPAAYAGVLAISNYSTETDAIQYGSNYGNHTWAAAPGDVVNHYTVGGGESTFAGDMGGTSAATAIATGIVARMLTGGRSPGNAVSYLADNARPTGASPTYEGNGVLQLAAAEQQLQQDKPTQIDLDGDPIMEDVPADSTSGDPITSAASDGTGNPDPGACG